MCHCGVWCKVAVQFSKKHFITRDNLAFQSPATSHTPTLCTSAMQISADRAPVIKARSHRTRTSFKLKFVTADNDIVLNTGHLTMADRAAITFLRLDISSLRGLRPTRLPAQLFSTATSRRHADHFGLGASAQQYVCVRREFTVLINFVIFIAFGHGGQDTVSKSPPDRKHQRWRLLGWLVDRLV